MLSEYYAVGLFVVWLAAISAAFCSMAFEDLAVYLSIIFFFSFSCPFHAYPYVATPPRAAKLSLYWNNVESTSNFYLHIRANEVILHNWWTYCCEIIKSQPSSLYPDSVGLKLYWIRACINKVKLSSLSITRPESRILMIIR